MATLSFFKQRFFGADFFQADFFEVAGIPVVVAQQRGGGGKKKHQRRLEAPQEAVALTHKARRNVVDKVLGREPVEETVAAESAARLLPIDVSGTPVEAAVAEAQASLARAQAAEAKARVEAARETFRRERAEKQRRIRAMNKAAMQDIRATQIERQRDEEEALLALLLAA